jgi:hypothetical protein
MMSLIKDFFDARYVVPTGVMRHASTSAFCAVLASLECKRVGTSLAPQYVWSRLAYTARRPQSPQITTR